MSAPPYSSPPYRQKQLPIQTSSTTSTDPTHETQSSPKRQPPDSYSSTSPGSQRCQPGAAIKTFSANPQDGALTSPLPATISPWESPPPKVHCSQNTPPSTTPR